MFLAKLKVKVDGPKGREEFAINVANSQIWTDEIVTIPDKYTGQNMEVSVIVSGLMVALYF